MDLQNQLQRELEKVKSEHGKQVQEIKKYWSLVNYLAAAQIYLKDNVLLDKPLKIDHIKDRLLGHWGTCPGINLVYSHANRLINEFKLNMFLVTGPGHGAPANLANLYVEQTLHDQYPDLSLCHEGLHNFIKRFSWPGGFPSHLYPGIPGTIHEGGELGYALSTSFGAVYDNPDLIVTCIVGDGEAETGPTATSWHSIKFLDPKESGAVLPILHINGYKISNPTLFGTMDDDELNSLFSGYGYDPIIVEGSDIHEKMYAAMNISYKKIKEIQDKARSNKPISKPKWPVILMRTLKGWTCVKELDGIKIEGNCKSHQVPIKDVKENPEHLKILEGWLRSYKVASLFDSRGSPTSEILKLCPKGDLRMGSNPHTFGGERYVALSLPPIDDFAIEKMTSEKNRGKVKHRSVKRFGEYLAQVIKKNPSNFRIFSPDELESNQLGAVFDVTHRNYQWPIKDYDKNISNQGGRIIEVLSEHLCQGWLQGYLLTGRHGLFPSYEAFLGIAATMMDQFAKFLKVSGEIEFRKPIASLNYLETSNLWRQEHNGFSHQSPGFINTLLNKKADVLRIYFPPDSNCLISTMNHCLSSQNYVNLVVASKQKMPQWLSMDEAIEHCRAGVSIWNWASCDKGINPDVVLVGVGDNPTLEIMAATSLIKENIPELKVRVVNVTDLLILEKNSLHPHGLDGEMFEAIFTKECPVIFNFHGYPTALKQLLYGRGCEERFQINGYIEEGTTTTPFDMSVRNKTSRYHIAMQAIRYASQKNDEVAPIAKKWITHFEYELWNHREFIRLNGVDPKEITEWEWEQ